jgi:hypothetical protein
MKKKKSRIELAREIIANLRHGMNRQPAERAEQSNLQIEATPFMPAPMARPGRNRPLHVSHSHS